MQTRNGRRVMELALVLCAMGTLTACASPSMRGQRLGTARPFAKTYLKIPGHALHSQDMFAVQLHAIGATRSAPNWVSTGTVLNENLMAQLDIVGDMSGNLKMSMLSTRLAKTYK
jgi:hypothetical protein